MTIPDKPGDVRTVLGSNVVINLPLDMSEVLINEVSSVDSEFLWASFLIPGREHDRTHTLLLWAIEVLEKKKNINMEIKSEKVYEGWMAVVRNLKLKKPCLTVNLVHLFMEGKVTNSLFCTSYILYWNWNYNGMLMKYEWSMPFTIIAFTIIAFVSAYYFHGYISNEWLTEIIA